MVATKADDVVVEFFSIRHVSVYTMSKWSIHHGFTTDLNSMFFWHCVEYVLSTFDSFNHVARCFNQEQYISWNPTHKARSYNMAIASDSNSTPPSSVLLVSFRDLIYLFRKKSEIRPSRHVFVHVVILSKSIYYCNI
jgi:hypothetical protein